MKNKGLLTIIGENASFRQRRAPSLTKAILYSLEEEADDFHSEKLLGVVQSYFLDSDQQPIIDLLAGKFDPENRDVQVEPLTNAKEIFISLPDRWGNRLRITRLDGKIES